MQKKRRRPLPVMRKVLTCAICSIAMVVIFSVHVPVFPPSKVPKFSDPYKLPTVIHHLFILPFLFLFLFPFPSFSIDKHNEQYLVSILLLIWVFTFPGTSPIFFSKISNFIFSYVWSARFNFSLLLLILVILTPFFKIAIIWFGNSLYVFINRLDFYWLEGSQYWLQI